MTLQHIFHRLYGEGCSRAFVPVPSSRRLIRGFAFVAALVFLACDSAHAQFTWSSTASGTLWSGTANWSSASKPANNFNNTLTFQGSPAGGLALNNDLSSGTATRITFASGAGAFTLTGNAFTLTGSIANLSSNTQTIQNNLTLLTTSTISGTSVTLSGTLSGTGGLTKLGSGTLTLSASNTFTGTATLNGGVLRAASNAAALGTGASTLTLTSGTLQLANNTGVSFGRNTTINGDVGITSDVLASGSAGVTHTLGTLSIGARTLSVAAGANVGSGTAGVTFGATTLTGNATFDTGPGSSLTLGAVGGAFNLTKSGSGVLALSAAGTYTGTTTIAGGVLRTTVANAITSGNDVVLSGSSTLDLQQAATLGNLVINAGAAGAAVTNSTATSRTLAIDTLTVNDNSTVGGTALSLTQSTNVGTDTWSVASGKTLALSSTAAFASAASRGRYLNLVNSGTITSGVALTNGIVGGGWLTVGAQGSNNDWATIASGTLVAMGAGGSAYDTIGTGGNRNVLAQGGGSVASGTWNTIKVSATTSGQSLAISSGTLTLAAGGIIFTGSNDYAITGSRLASKQGSTNSDLVVYQNGSGNLTISSTIANGNGAQTLTKFGSGKLTLGANNTYTGATYLSGGTLAFSADNPNLKAIQYGLVVGDATTSTLDIQSNVTATSLFVYAIGSGTNYLNVDAGKTLTVTGSVQIGPWTDTQANLPSAGSTNLVAQGSGTFAMNSNGGTFLMEGGQAAGGSSVNVTANFTGISSLVINTGTTGTGKVEVVTGRTNGNYANDATLSLAPSTVITTPLLAAGNSNWGGRGTINFGSGINTINANTINITGVSGANPRSQGVMKYLASDTTGSLVIRAADGSGPSEMYINNHSSTTTAALSGTFNVLGHLADVRLSTLSVGNRVNANNTFGTTDFFGWDRGSLDVSGTVQLLTFAQTTRSKGSLALMTIGSTNSSLSDTATLTGGFAMAINSSTWSGANAASGTATLNIAGASVTSGPITLGDLRGTDAGAGSTATLNITGGRLTMTGAIRSGTGGGAGTLTSTLNLDGGTLDMGGFAIGGASGSGGITTLSFVSGSLTNVSAINGSAGLTKTTSGTLTLSGSSTYAGVTAVESGVVRFDTLATGAAAQALGSNATVNLGVAGTSTGEINYFGAGGTLDKNVFALGTGRNRIRNSGAGTLALSGTLTKDSTILELAGGAFTVSGRITGASANSDLFVNGATVTLTNANNDYNGPTYVYGGGSLTLGASNVIPSTSLLILGGTGGDTGTGTLATGTFSAAIGGLSFGSAGGTLAIAASAAGGAAQLTAATGTMTLSGGTLDLTGSGTTAGYYRLLSAQSITDSFATITGSNAAYRVLTSATSYDYQQRAVLGGVTVTNPTVSIITGGTAAFTYSVTNAAADGGASLSFTGTGLSSNVIGTSNGTAAGGGASGAISGLAFTGTGVGLGQLGTFTVSDPSAFGGTSLTGTVSLNVLNHSLASFTATDTASTSLDFGTYENGVWTGGDGGNGTLGYSIFNIASLGFSNAQTAGLDLYDWVLTGGDGSAFSLGSSAFQNLASGSSNGFFASVLTPGSLAGGPYTATYTLKFRDQQNLSGAGDTRDLTLTLNANVIVVPEPTGLTLAGLAAGIAAVAIARRRSSLRA